MSEERNPTVPFGTFYHPPVQLADVMREKNCLNSTTFAVMNGLFSLVDFNKTYRIGDHDVFIGWTCVVSYGGLGDRCGLSGRRTQDALKKLETAGLIVREKVGKCNRYRVTLYDQALDHLRANPGTPMKQISQPIGSEEHRKNIKKIQDDASRTTDDETSDIEPITDESSESLRTERPSHYGRSVPHSRVLQEELQETPVSDYPGPNEETEKRGDSLIEEKQEIDVVPVSEAESVEPEEKASLEEKKEGADFVPTKQIAEVVDSLAKGMNMNVSDPDPDLEQMFRSLNPQSGVVVTGLDLQVASKLKEQLIEVLGSAAIEMPPMLFFKHCIQEMDNRVADGKIQVRPTSLNFFLNAHTGKEIIADRVDKLRSENQAANNIEKTNAYLQEQQERPRGMSAETKAELDKLLGRT